MNAPAVPARFGCCVHCQRNGTEPGPCPCFATGHDMPCPECSPRLYPAAVLPVLEQVWPELARKAAGKRTAIEQVSYAELSRMTVERLGVPVRSVEVRVFLVVPPELACPLCKSARWLVDPDSLGALLCDSCGAHITADSLLSAARAAGKLPAPVAGATEGEQPEGGGLSAGCDRHRLIPRVK